MADPIIENLLVPLDGSRLAEAVLPAAAHLAKALAASITLYHVVEQNAPETVHGEPHLSNLEEAGAYLDDVAARPLLAELPIHCHVHAQAPDNVASSIVAHTQELDADLIAMCTHGQGGLRSRLYGSIAQRVVAFGTTPLLLVQPSPGTMPNFTCRHLLVPLDQDPEHEQSLEMAAYLAGTCDADVRLLTVVPTRQALTREQAATATLLPGAMTALLNLTQQRARAHLAQQATSLEARGLSVSIDVRRGDPTNAIVHAAHQSQSDLIVLGTHGKTNLDAFWSGSLTPRISRRTQLPLLLVPVRLPKS